MSHRVSTHGLYGYPELFSALLFFFLTLPWIWLRGLQNPDELRYGAVVIEMVARSDYVVPHLNSVLYFEKPPLLYWLGVLAVKLFGNYAGVLRLCSVASGFGIVVLACKFGRMYGGLRVSLYSGVVAATTIFLFVFSQAFTTDILVAFLITMAVYFSIKIVGEDTDTESEKWNAYKFYVACGFGVLAKGLIGIVLPALVLLTYAVCMNSYKKILKLLRLDALVIFFVITVPWFFLLEIRYPGFLKFYFFNEHFLRYTTDLHQRQKDYWYLPMVFMAGLIPWSFFALAAIFIPVSANDRNFLSPTTSVLLKSWVIVVLVFFWVSKSLLPGYLLPVVMPTSVLIGGYIYQSGRTHVSRACAALSAVFFIGLLLMDCWPDLFGVSLPFSVATGVDKVLVMTAYGLLAATFCALAYFRVGSVAPIVVSMVPALLLIGYFATCFSPKSLKDFFVPDRGWYVGRRVVVYKTYVLDPVYYLAAPVIFIDRIGELAFGNSIEPRVDFFWDSAKLVSEIQMGGKFSVIGREQELSEVEGLRCLAKKDGFMVCTAN